MYVIYHYINIYQDPVVGLSLGFLSVFLFIWGLSYFIFLIVAKFFSSSYDHLSSLCYKLSLIFGLFVMVNITFFLVEQRNVILGIVLLA